MYTVCRGVEINDKHVECYRSSDAEEDLHENSGDTEFLPGTLVDVLDFEEINENLSSELGERPAEGVQVMLGITKASCYNSFLSAASFPRRQTKVLTEAAIKARLTH